MLYSYAWNCSPSIAVVAADGKVRFVIVPVVVVVEAAAVFVVGSGSIKNALLTGSSFKESLTACKELYFAHS